MYVHVYINVHYTCTKNNNICTFYIFLATRNYQAELFNSSKVKVLVASDAIGMGINL